MILRLATPDDAEDMCAILNAIIAIGGTTAYEVPFTRETMIANYVSAPRLIACHVADSDGIIGFQALWRARPEEGFADGWAVIATFAKPGLTKTGIGSALFQRTAAAARSAGIMTIDATIRADNAGGLAYYSRQGFRDYDRLIGVPLRDGTPVDRVRRRFDL